MTSILSLTRLNEPAHLTEVLVVAGGRAGQHRSNRAYDIEDEAGWYLPVWDPAILMRYLRRSERIFSQGYFALTITSQSQCRGEH
jgi:hypothetical protein